VLNVSEMVHTLRTDASEAVWSAAVRLARDGAVRGVEADAEELKLHVKTRARALPYEVYLWPGEGDHGCDCSLPAPCVHVCAAAIAVQQGLKTEGTPMPRPATRYQVAIRYDFVRSGGAKLSVSRAMVWPDGREQRLATTLAQADVLVAREDAQAESLLSLHPGGPLDEEALRKLLIILDGMAPATLDGAPVRLSAESIAFVVKVGDEGAGSFRVGLYRPSGLDAVFLGAALRGGTLHPTSYGTLPERQRRMLHPRRDEAVFGIDQAGWLVSELLPKLESYGLSVEIETERLPRAEALVPRVVVDLANVQEGLRVLPELVYGDPPVARVRGQSVIKLGAAVPVRDFATERRVAQDFQMRTRLVVGFERVLPPADAIVFLRQTLPQLGVEVSGGVDESRFRVDEVALAPVVNVGRTGDGDPGSSTGYSLDVRFRAGDSEAEVEAVLRAWRTGRSLVPLIGGGYAPLPASWMSEHGALLQELLEARDVQGRVHRHATAALVELIEDTEGEVPHDLSRLRNFLEAGEELPEHELPEGFVAELRPYQLTGYRWLCFQRDMDLHGILADDMGLGKTVQALAAMAATPGPHLVVAPTSVLSNWAREAKRFAPRLKVNLYHGAARRLDPTADLTLTSYALLRLDLQQLGNVPWSWLVLDEAQAIKNPDSQTAKAACELGARHRLALTGTPVENRLEELWSLFRFLMPGLLGPRSSFRDRFVRPIEIGDPEARTLLQRRVRPYVLRRLKQQVAQDLPPLTDVVVRCEMEPEQRRVYEAVRQAMRRDVMEALGMGVDGRSTMQILEALLRMRQACCDPSLLPGRFASEAGSCKLDRLEELLVDIVTAEHKALVFSQWTSMLDRVEPRLRALGIDWVRLDGSTRDRQTVIDKFQADDGPPVFLLSLKAGGTGLNLTAADYVVHLDPWWNPAVEQQATDRAHRIGQDKPVVSCRLIAEGTVEERILELQEAKRDLADAALGGEAGVLRALSAEELRSLFDEA
jgi:superfamily II DNA or RNA helicase